MRPCPENPAIAALEGLLAKNRGTSEAPVHLFLLASLLAGAGSPKRSGAQPQGGRVRGASARRALETGQGGRHVPRELVLARFRGRRLLGAQGAERLSSPLGDWICAKRFLLTSQPPVGGCAGSYFSAQRAALFVFSCRECEPRFAWLSTASVWLKIG